MSEATAMTYSQILKSERKKRRLTVEKMAELLDVSYTSIITWENGKHYPDAVRRKVIKDTLGIDLPERSRA